MRPNGFSFVEAPLRGATALDVTYVSQAFPGANTTTYDPRDRATETGEVQCLGWHNARWGSLCRLFQACPRSLQIAQIGQALLDDPLLFGGVFERLGMRSFQEAFGGILACDREAGR